MIGVVQIESSTDAPCNPGERHIPGWRVIRSDTVGRKPPMLGEIACVGDVLLSVVSADRRVRERVSYRDGGEHDEDRSRREYRHARTQSVTGRRRGSRSSHLGEAYDGGTLEGEIRDGD